MHKNTRSDNSTFFVDHKNFDDPKNFDNPKNFVDPNNCWSQQLHFKNEKRIFFSHKISK